MRRPLPDTTLAVLSLFNQVIEARGVPPLTREIAAVFNWNHKAQAQHHIQVLEARGYLERRPLAPVRRGVRSPVQYRVTKAGLEALTAWRAAAKSAGSAA